MKEDKLVKYLFSTKNIQNETYNYFSLTKLKNKNKTNLIMFCFFLITFDTVNNYLGYTKSSCHNV